jgi:hypothetical protein
VPPKSARVNRLDTFQRKERVNPQQLAGTFTLPSLKRDLLRAFSAES